MSDQRSIRDEFLHAIRTRLVGPANLEGTTELVLTHEPLTEACVALPAQSTANNFRVRDDSGKFQEAFIGGGRAGDSPVERYGIGTLHPAPRSTDPLVTEQLHESDDGEEFTSTAELLGPTSDAVGGISEISDGDSADEETRKHRNVVGQQSLGLAFIAPKDAKTVNCVLSGGFYSPVAIMGDSENSNRKMWIRKDFRCTIDLDLSAQQARQILPTEANGASIEIGCVKKADSNHDQYVTVFATNRTVHGTIDERILFQATLSVELRDGKGSPVSFVPFTQTVSSSIDLLFQHRKVFARGRGSSPCWDEQLPTINRIWTDPLPVTQVPTVSSDVSSLLLKATPNHMWEMANYRSADNSQVWLTELQLFGDLYLKWIDSIERESSHYEMKEAELAAQHVHQCRRAHARFTAGLTALANDGVVLRAFCLTNQSMSKSRTMGSPGQQAAPRWRPFQLFFLVMNLVGIADPSSDDRGTVEMVWLPTGGGKTEAYFAAASLAIWLRRLRGMDRGVVVFMRYTLRLLTAQQFQRASRLVTAMESIRRREIPETKPITIGIWLGGDQLPNRHADATALLSKMEGGSSSGSFGVSACPACGEAIGLAAAQPLEVQRGRKRFTPTSARTIPGVRKAEPGRNGVVLHCPNNSCEFHEELPLLVVDEAIYESPPDILLATVDKIATLSWTPKARTIFGIDADGKRTAPGFDLIIQDELHLIAGAIGTAVATYEPLVELLNSHGVVDVQSKPHRTKLICATATISNFERQVEQLYSRKDAVLFPPPGLVHGETFFTTARDADGNLNQGTLYCGIYGPALRSIQTVQARVLAAAVEAGDGLSSEGDAVDPWWTNVAFFNSLRELGYAVTLVDTDVPDYLRVWGSNRSEASGSERALPLRRLELTSRIAGDQVPEMLRMLEMSYPQADAYDICLASTMIEVGLDVDRLGLMAVMGQPK